MTKFVAPVIALVAITGLVIGALAGLHSVNAQASAKQVHLSQLDDDYYACLAVQAHSLVRPGQTVELSPANPGAEGILAKVVASWTVITADRARAAAVLSLTLPGTGSCLGSTVVATYPTGTVRRGTGASIRGSQAQLGSSL